MNTPTSLLGMRSKSFRVVASAGLVFGAIVFLGINLVSYALWLPSNDDIRTNDRPLVWYDFIEDAQGQASAATTTMAQKSLLAAGFDRWTVAKHLQELPTDASIVEQYGNRPILLGLDTCQAYRNLVPAEDRMLGAAGMFSTGTNLVTQLLKRNCRIPERVKLYGADATKEQLGMRWQVPWGKHTPASFKEQHHASEKAAAINRDHVLPIITIRNPWRWMQSTCRNPYAAKWPHHSQCPNLRVDNVWNEVTVKYGAASVQYQSLAHLWNDWYRSYLNTSLNGTKDGPKYPWLMVRNEDLTFYTKETIAAICECAGGELNEPFVYIADSAKADSPGHDTSTGILEAWIKYGRPMQSAAGFATDDYLASKMALDRSIMDLFQYKDPPSPS